MEYHTKNSNKALIFCNQQTNHHDELISFEALMSFKMHLSAKGRKKKKNFALKAITLLPSTLKKLILESGKVDL